MSNSNTDKNNEQVINLLFQLGESYLEKRNYDNSIEKFKSIIDLGEADAKVYLKLSKAYILKEQFDEQAQKVFEKSLQFEPENPVLNVVLGQLYLAAGREDSQALTVYQNALKHTPENADEISAMLIKASFQQENIEIARELVQQFIYKPEKMISLLPLYIVNEWKHQGFDRVTQYLRSAIKVQEKLSFYRWLVVNYLQAEKQSLEPFELSIEDLSLCNHYLENINSYDQLLDIFLYPAVERMLLKNIKKFQSTSSTGIEEYEIFLAENAFSNIWEQGLNKKRGSQNVLDVQEGGIWEKLKPWHLSENNNAVAVVAGKDEMDSIDSILKDAETLMIVRLKNTTSDDVDPVLVKSISKVSEAGQTFAGGFKSCDGFLLFWKDVNCPLRIARDFIQDQLVRNHSSSNNEARFQFVVHKLSRQGNDLKINIVNDLQTALAIFQLEREMFFQDNHLDQMETMPERQLLVTSALKEKLDDDNQFLFEPIELPDQYLTTEKNLQFYRLTWDDSHGRIRQGEIQEIGHFRLLKEIHHNQVFTSFKAIDSFLDRLVVVKILNPGFKTGDNQDSMAQLFLQQAKFLGQLSHPNIAMVYDIGIEQDFGFLAREFVDGIPLSVQRSINKKINVKRTLEIFLQIVQTLKSIHDQNIFHGRLQPNNIFVLNNSDIKITDFHITSFTTPAKLYQMSPHKYLSYFAPEQINNNKADILTDIFSLGTIMYEMLTDTNPFYNENRDKIFNNILKKTPAPPSSYNPELATELDHIILKTIDKSPNKRYQNIEELEKELLEIIG